MSFDKNHLAYREVFSERKVPCVPYVALVLRDLTAFGEAEADAPPRFNFNKRTYLSGTISRMLYYQKHGYDGEDSPIPTTPTTAFLRYTLENQTLLQEKTLDELSLLCQDN